MTFPEIFKQFKNHIFIRRESWENNVFIQLRHTTLLIRLVKYEIRKSPETLDNDIRLSAEDLIADDWIDINIEDFMSKKPSKPKTLWEYIDTLDNGSDKWREAIDLGVKYHKDGKNPDEYLEEIINKVEHSKN